MKLVFIDPKCPRPYDPEVLATQGLGGTEATVVRIATALSADHEVRVFQHNRTQRLDPGPGLSFLPPNELDAHLASADHIVFIQKAQDLSTVRRASRGRCWLWLHNYVKDEVPFYWQDHLRHRLGIICVSRAHALHTLDYLRSQRHSWLSARAVLRGGLLYLHNPLQPGIEKLPPVEVDRNKLVFFSSPYKGIEQVLAQFRLAYQREPQLRLYVADPGYIRNFDASQLDHPGIIRLGSLPQAQVLEQVRQALCVFYPQTRRAETFGLVYAESNAVGTPVLAHDFGAAREILAAGNPPIDVNAPGRVLETLFQWRDGARPRVGADARFSLPCVAAQWRQFLADPQAFIAGQRLLGPDARA
ncbi:MAG: glycosyltransferase [Burkholderiaceae bacterium]